MNVGVEDIVVAGVIVCASVAGIITHVLLLIALKVINSYKVERVFPMVVDSLLPHAGFGPNDN